MYSSPKKTLNPLTRLLRLQRKVRRHPNTAEAKTGETSKSKPGYPIASEKSKAKPRLRNERMFGMWQSTQRWTPDLVLIPPRREAENPRGSRSLCKSIVNELFASELAWLLILLTRHLGSALELSVKLGVKVGRKASCNN